MQRIEINFLPDDELPTDEHLCLQLVYGLCGQIRNPREEHCESFVTSVGIPYPQVRRLAKLLVQKLGLPIPIDRVDQWVDFQRSNEIPRYVVNEKLDNRAKELAHIPEKR